MDWEGSSVAGGCGRRMGAGELTGRRRGIRGLSMGALQRSVPLEGLCCGGAMESGCCGSSGYREWLRWGGARVCRGVVGCSRRGVREWIGSRGCPGSGDGSGRLERRWWVREEEGGGGVDGSRWEIRGLSMGVSRRSVPLKRLSGAGAIESGWSGSGVGRCWLGGRGVGLLGWLDRPDSPKGREGLGCAQWSRRGTGAPTVPSPKSWAAEVPPSGFAVCSFEARGDGPLREDCVLPQRKSREVGSKTQERGTGSMGRVR